MRASLRIDAKSSAHPLVTAAVLAAVCVLLPVCAAADVVLSALPDAAKANVLAYLTLDDLDCDASNAEHRRALDRAPDQIRDALAALGFYQPQIAIDLSTDDDCPSYDVVVDPGPQIRYGDVDIRVDGIAAGDAGVVRAMENAPKTDEALDHGRYARFKRSMQTTLANRGFVEATIDESSVSVTIDQQRADLDWRVTGGPRYTIGDIEVVNSVFDADLIRRLITLESGTPFDRSALVAQQRRLQSSALIASARVEARPEPNPEKQVPLTIHIEPVERIGYFIGAGASTDRGPRVRGGYRNRRVNSAGHQFDLDLRVSPVLSDIGARYRRPLENPVVEWEAFEIGGTRERTDTSDSDIARIGWERVRVLGGDWVVTYGIQASETEFTVADLDERTRLVMPVMRFNHRDADDVANPTAGNATDVNLRLASSDALSSTDFAQIYLRQRWLVPVGSRGAVRLRAELGYTWRDEFDELPPEIRFFAGGDTSVRGYDFETLGPQDADGDVIGGARLATLSAEYEHRLNDAFGVAAFYDIGSAFDDDDPNWRRGVGLGVVWHSPVGPLRAYLGHALDGDRGVRLHVLFGADL